MTRSVGPCLVSSTEVDDRRMSGWHPSSKIVVACGTLAIGLLLFDGSSEAPATVAVARPRPPGDVVRAPTDPALGAILRATRRLDLAPPEAFEVVLERPLFTPSRRPARAIVPAAVAPQPEMEPEAERRVEEPPFRLVGTVSRRGRSEALVAPTAGGELARVEPGAAFAGWIVTGIGPAHLEVERDGIRRRLEILR